MSELNKYLIDQLPNDMKHTEFFDILNTNNYDLNPFYEELLELVPVSTKDNFYWINYAYKSLSQKKPLDVLLPQDRIAQLITTIKDKSVEGFYDISAMALGYNINITVDVSDDSTIKEIAQRIEYYHKYGKLLESSLVWNKPTLNKVLVKLTTNHVGISEIDISKLLPSFEILISKLPIESSILLNRFNDCFDSKITNINKDNILATVKQTFYAHSIQIINELTSHIHEVVKIKLAEIPVDTLFQQKVQPTFYWLLTAKTLIEGKVLKSLPDNFVEFVKKIFIDISMTASIPNETVNVIIQKMPSSKLTSTLSKILKDYYSGLKAINKNMFIFFESYFRKSDIVQERYYGDFTTMILEKVIDDIDCRNLILNKNDFYQKIILGAGDHAEDLKVKIRKLVIGIPSEELTEFASSILAIDEKKDENNNDKKTEN